MRVAQWVVLIAQCWDLPLPGSTTVVYHLSLMYLYCVYYVLCFTFALISSPSLSLNPQKAAYRCRVAKSSSSMDSSAIVLMSPRSASLRVTFARMRRMILPDLVLGRALTGCTTSGAARAPILSRAARKMIEKRLAYLHSKNAPLFLLPLSLMSFSTSGLKVKPFLRTTKQ